MGHLSDAPSSAAYARLPPGIVDARLKPLQWDGRVAKERHGEGEGALLGGRVEGTGRDAGATMGGLFDDDDHEEEDGDEAFVGGGGDGGGHVTLRDDDGGSSTDSTVAGLRVGRHEAQSEPSASRRTRGAAGGGEGRGWRSMEPGGSRARTGASASRGSGGAGEVPRGSGTVEVSEAVRRDASEGRAHASGFVDGVMGVGRDGKRRQSSGRRQLGGKGLLFEPHRYVLR